MILGGSGCGKSSLLKNMIGLYRPSTGRILFDGDDIVTATGDDRLRLLRKFGVMYQSGALFGSMTVLENVRLPLDEFTDLEAEREGPRRDGEAQPRGPPAGGRPETVRALGRDAETRRHRPSDGARPRDPLPRRAVGGPRPDHVGRPRPDDPGAVPRPRHHVRRRDPRAPEHLRDRRPLRHAGRADEDHHRRRKARGPARPFRRPVRPPVLSPPGRAGRGDEERARLHERESEPVPNRDLRHRGGGDRARWRSSSSASGRRSSPRTCSRPT